MGNDAAAEASRIDEFVERSRLLEGREICERLPWNTVASADAIRHFAYGTSDDNPLWLDPGYARGTVHGRLVAPPAFLCSVLYPFLHGEPMETPLTFLISGVEFEWRGSILEDDRLEGTARLLRVTEGIDRKGRRLVSLLAETLYRNGRGEEVARALGTMAGVARVDGELLVDREIHRCGAAELAALHAAIESESRTGGRGRTAGEAAWGDRLPPKVRGPLTVGDLVCWQAAIGPSYRAGTLGYRDALRAPHTAAIHPLTGWPVKYSQQHEDFLLAAQRGMPAPFDNSLMRFAWVAPLLTDWMGDTGFLRRLRIQTAAPLLYGDVTRYSGIIVAAKPEPDATGTVFTVQISGVNQLGQTSTTGEAEVWLPAVRALREGVGSVRARRKDPGRSDPAPGLSPDPLEGFAARRVERPDAPALIAGVESISFGELDRRSNQLARVLAERGAGPGVLAGLLAGRGAETVIALMAILKSGSAYLPLDPALPAARLQSFVRSAAPGLLVAEERWRGRLHEPAAGSAGGPGPAPPAVDTGLPVHELAGLLGAAAGASPEPPARRSGPGELAYAMPTSGSLGQPRIVAVGRAALAASLRAMDTCLETGADDVWLHGASFGFSASVRQLFVPLSQGAAVVLASADEQRDPLALLALMKRRGVTVWDTVPAVWGAAIEALRALPEESREELLRNRLRLILSTGEALPWRVPQTWRETLRHPARMVNLYSQTETSGAVCFYSIPDGSMPGHGLVPLGCPAPLSEILLLGESDQPAEPGSVGEIHVGGPRLADGYLGQPERTHQRFPRVTFPGRDEERLYRTGDLAIRPADGVLQFVGRADDRVKIRGQRLHLSEVEEAMRSHPEIAEAVVVWSEEGPGGESRLTGYFAARGDGGPEPADLKHYLRGLLSAAAVPEVLVRVPALPRTPSGKPDRAALPGARAALGEAVPRGGSPQTLVEQGLAALWTAVLGVRVVGRGDNFFDLGGHSLNAARVVDGIRRQFAVDLPLLAFFDAATLADCAAEIERRL